jgi:hypothetical protein
MGEILRSSETDCSQVPMGSDLCPPVFHLPFTKTTGAVGANAMSSISYVTARGQICLTCRKYLLRCNEIWKACEIQAVSSHSFRIGGTTELLINGGHPDVVRMMGRWNSDFLLEVLVFSGFASAFAHGIFGWECASSVTATVGVFSRVLAHLHRCLVFVLVGVFTEHPRTRPSQSRFPIPTVNYLTHFRIDVFISIFQLTYPSSTAQKANWRS